MNIHEAFNKANSKFAGLQQSTVCQGSMGLHQNNFKHGNMPKHGSSFNENVIAEVFRKFKDHCVSKFRDNVNGNLTIKHECKENGKCYVYIILEGFIVLFFLNCLFVIL